MNGRLHSFSAACFAVLGVLFLSASSAAAQTCTVTSANGAYGNVDILSGTASPTTSSFTIACTGTAGRTIRACVEFGAGTNVGGSTTQRSLINNANSALGLNHEIYSDPARTTVYGSWGSFITAYAAAGKQVDLLIPVSGSVSSVQTAYGRTLAGQQSVIPGSFTWNTGSPALRYAYAAAVNCPIAGGATTSAAGRSNWTAVINANCLIAATTVDFGSNGILAANVDAAGSLSVQCTNTTPYVVSLGLGTGTGVTLPTARKMTKGAETVTYGIYSDTARSVAWGTGAGQTVSGTGTGNAASIPVYGRIPRQTTPSAGVYNDTVVVTVTY